MRTARRAHGTSRTRTTTARGGALTALVLLGAILLSACTTPAPPPAADPVETSTAALREQLLQIEGLADPAQTRSGLDYELQITIADPDRAEEVTREAVDAFFASDVRDAITQEVAESYDSAPRFQLSVLPAGSARTGPHLDLVMASEADTQTLADAVATWTRMGQIEGVVPPSGSFEASAFTITYSVDFAGLLAGVRPTAVTAQLRQILTDGGYDAAASTITGVISVPEAVNTVDGEGKSVQGTRFARVFIPLKAAVGPHYGSVLYFLPGDEIVDIYVTPALAPDGTLLPLELTAESARAVGQVIQTEHLYTSWTLRDIIVFTQDGMQTFPAGA